MKILIAVDGSEYTQRTLAFAAAHEDWFDARHRYTVLYCVPALPHPAAAFVGVDRAVDFYEDDAQTVLKPVREYFASRGVAVDCVHRIGAAGPTIAEFADRQGFDLVILGSHGRGAVAGVVMGSVATKVLALCRTPVLLVR